MALLNLDIKKDEIIILTLTFVADIKVHIVGATSILADCGSS